MPYWVERFNRVMYKKSVPMCRLSSEGLERTDFWLESAKDEYPKVERFFDGTSKVTWGGPCGSTCYDKYGTVRTFDLTF